MSLPTIKKHRICSYVNNTVVGYVNRFANNLAGKTVVKKDTAKQSCIRCISEAHQIYLYDAGFYHFYFVRVDDSVGIPINLPNNLYRMRMEDISTDISTLNPLTTTEIVSTKMDVVLSDIQLTGLSDNINDININDSRSLSSNHSIRSGLNLLT